MEDFINGYTGSEHGRYTVSEMCAKQKAEFLFDRMQHSSFGEDEIKFIKSWGGEHGPFAFELPAF